MALGPRCIGRHSSARLAAIWTGCLDNTEKKIVDGKICRSQLPANMSERRAMHRHVRGNFQSEVSNQRVDEWKSKTCGSRGANSLEAGPQGLGQHGGKVCCRQGYLTVRIGAIRPRSIGCHVEGILGTREAHTQTAKTDLVKGICCRLDKAILAQQAALAHGAVRVENLFLDLDRENLSLCCGNASQVSQSVSQAVMCQTNIQREICGTRDGQDTPLGRL